MTWRPWFTLSVRQQLDGFPPDAFDVLIELMVRLCTDPYDRLHSMPRPGRPRDRIAEIDDRGWIEFRIEEEAGLLRVYRLVWTG